MLSTGIPISTAIVATIPQNDIHESNVPADVPFSKTLYQILYNISDISFWNFEVIATEIRIIIEIRIAIEIKNKSKHIIISCIFYI